MMMMMMSVLTWKFIEICHDNTPRLTVDGDKFSLYTF